MSPRIRVAVVIPCYNDGATLPETVRSVLAQEPTELVVVDDGSGDPGTMAVIQQLEEEGVLVVRQENSGPAGARMAGVRVTSAPFVFPLDADDVLLPGALTALVEALDSHPDAVAAWGDTRFFGDVDRRVASAHRIDPWRMTFVNELPAAALFRRQPLVDAGGWAIKRGYEDWGLWMALPSAAATASYIGREVTRYRVHGRRMWRDSAARHDEIVAELRRHHPNLFSQRPVNKRRSSSSALIKLGLPVIEQLPLPARGRIVLANVFTRPGAVAPLAIGLRVTRARRRLAPTRPTISPAPAPLSEHNSNGAATRRDRQSRQISCGRARDRRSRTVRPVGRCSPPRRRRARQGLRGADGKLGAPHARGDAAALALGRVADRRSTRRA